MNRGRPAGARLSCWMLVSLGLALAAPASAQHEHHHQAEPGAPSLAVARPFAVALRVVAARYDQTLYAGDYAGLGLDLGSSRGRWTLHAAIPGYHLRKNGGSVDGLGDVGLGLDATLLQRGDLAVGGGLSVTLPTGDAMTGLGMGHPMLMPALWASLSGSRTSVGVSAGWCRAVGADDAHRDHGAWPLVEPMSASELMGDAHGEVALGSHLVARAKLAAAVPLQGDRTRLVAGLGGAWRGGRTETGVELQAGLAGDPFTLRAQVTSTLRF